MITQKRLKEVLKYNPDTGLFIWLIDKNRQAKAGDVAGAKMKHGHIRIWIDGAAYLAHRLAFLYVEGDMPGSHVDHINHNGSDNRWENIRHATIGDNMKNQSKYKNNTTGVTGVSFDKGLNKYRAYINNNGKRLWFGPFDDINAAILTRKVSEVAYGYHVNHGS